MEEEYELVLAANRAQIARLKVHLEAAALVLPSLPTCPGSGSRVALRQELTARMRELASLADRNLEVERQLVDSIRRNAELRAEVARLERRIIEIRDGIREDADSVRVYERKIAAAVLSHDDNAAILRSIREFDASETKIKKKKIALLETLVWSDSDDSFTDSDE